MRVLFLVECTCTLGIMRRELENIRLWDQMRFTKRRAITKCQEEMAGFYQHTISAIELFY